MFNMWFTSSALIGQLFFWCSCRNRHQEVVIFHFLLQFVLWVKDSFILKEPFNTTVTQHWWPRWSLSGQEVNILLLRTLKCTSLALTWWSLTLTFHLELRLKSNKQTTWSKRRDDITTSDGTSWSDSMCVNVTVWPRRRCRFMYSRFAVHHWRISELARLCSTVLIDCFNHWRAASLSF